MSDLVRSSPSGASSAQGTLDVLVERGMAILDGATLVAIDGLSVRPTPHRLTLGGAEFFTWCAADAIGIPAALEEDSQVATSCPHCSAAISLSIRGGVPTSGGDLVLWLPTSSCTHVVTQFCPDVNFFCNREHLDAWRAGIGEPVGEVLSAEAAAQLGRQWWAYLRPQTESVGAG
jgi:alkylmercury lyase